MKFRRIFDKRYNFKLRKKRKELELRLTDFFGYPVVLRQSFRKSSDDNIYEVLSGNKIIAMARVRNEFRLKAIAKSFDDYNRILRELEKNFQREWDKSKKASLDGLAPEPLFREEGVSVFRFIEGKKALDVIKKDCSNFESILATILEALDSLYRLGMVHGDLAIYNCIITKEGRCVFFDLEDDVPNFDSFAKKVAYEYLHLIDSSLKFLTPKYKKIEFWVEIFNKHLSIKAKGIDTTFFSQKAGRFTRLNKIDPGFKKIKEAFMRP